jgi:primosomal protein N' (replication factor Y)
MSRRIVEVAVNVPLLKLFHYSVPDGLADRIEVGHRVLIPFGRRSATGICVGFPESSDVPGLKPVREILHPDCRFDAHLLELTRWVARYYAAPWGEVLEAALPPPIRSGREAPVVARVSAARSSGALLAEGERLASRARARSRLLVFLAKNPGPHRRAELLRHAAADAASLRWAVEGGWAVEERSPARPDAAKAAREMAALSGLSSRAPETLHADQVEALDAVRDAIRSGTFRTVLLHGVTGSGKTEVYLRALREVLAGGKRGLVLVPEISLTPQVVLRFREGLSGESVAVLHSRLTPSERAAEWREIQRGSAKLIIGARSAVFAPIPDLSLIVVDEEHDGSYKQESSPRYHGRDVAVMRARMLGITAVLGSATPSLESCRNARAGKYRLVVLPRRVTSHDLPVVTIVPLGPEYYRLDGSGLITVELDRLVRAGLQRKEQALFFLNRRGFATFLHCTRCGFVLKCGECDITLTFHRSENAARCHYCGGTRTPPVSCPECGFSALRRAGVGTEKIAAEIARRYPEARVARLDRDTAGSQRSMLDTLGQFARGEHDILVGTQMVAKGHDFPGVTLVGIINADTGLHFPDFRSAERTFQLVTQVAGRAGRGERPGRVVIQTFFPEHFAIVRAARGEYGEFAREELEHRRALGYPPFGRIVKILFQGTDPERVAAEAARAAALLREDARDARVLGAVPAPITRIQGKHRFQILLKSASSTRLHALIERLEAALPERAGVERSIDVDPQSML